MAHILQDTLSTLVDYVPSKLNNENLALATLGQALDRLVLSS